MSIFTIGSQLISPYDKEKAFTGATEASILTSQILWEGYYMSDTGRLHWKTLLETPCYGTGPYFRKCPPMYMPQSSVLRGCHWEVNIKKWSAVEGIWGTGVSTKGTVVCGLFHLLSVPGLCWGERLRSATGSGHAMQPQISRANQLWTGISKTEPNYIFLFVNWFISGIWYSGGKLTNTEGNTKEVQTQLSEIISGIYETTKQGCRKEWQAGGRLPWTDWEDFFEEETGKAIYIK